MKRHLGFTLISLLFVCLFAIFSFAQETSGSLQGTVRDQNGAVIPNATVTASNQQRTYTETTNDAGDYLFATLPPGVYVIEVKATNFGTLRREAVTIELGKSIGANFEMKPAAAGANVTVVAEDEPLVDLSSSKTSTNITEKKIDLLPKGLRFSSVIETAPGVRNEAKGAGFQIDGASGSENVWVVDGLEVTRTFGGQLGSTKNLPLEFVKEVQVKTAGYEAEFGGALGGVINVTTRPGGNALHGVLSTEYESSRFRASDRLSRRWDRAALAESPSRRAVNYFKSPDGKDNVNNIAPRFTLNGPILKNKTWFSVGWAPEFITTKRTLRLIEPFTATTTTPTVLNTRTVESRVRNEQMFGRIDASPLRNLSAYVSYFLSPSKTNGTIPGAYEYANPSVTFSDPRLSLKGGYAPANAFTSQVTYNPLSNLIVSFRFGRNYLNDKGSNYDTNPTIATVGISNICGPPIVGCPPNTLSTGTIVNGSGGTAFDITTRKYITADATWVKRFFGQQHTFKGGFQRTLIANNVSSDGGSGISPLGLVSVFFNASDQFFDPPRRGTYGYYTVTQVAAIGTASSKNDALFFQDSWQIHRRVTLNLGIRTENENVPTWGFGGTAVPAAIKFGWGDKFAPRLGGAWDVMGDGRLKIYASYSVFYDTMKYDLPRGSFGGEVQKIYHRGLETLDAASLSVINQPGELFALEDQRTPSTVPYMVGDRILHGIDPDLKPVKEHEITVGADYAWKSDIVFSTRFTRKVLDRTIDDTGIPSENFENYCICNPGFGASVADLQSFGYPPTPKAVREYTGLEFRVDKRFSHNWYVNGTYLWSRLYGNYSGLASSDESGRGNPNVNRFFDVPWINITASGALNNGLLATDRPNTFKIFAGRQFNFNLLGKRWESYWGGSQYIYQGTPLSTTAPVQLLGRLENGVSCVVGSCNHYVSTLINGRGDLGRTDWYTQTDGTMTTRIYLNERGVALRFGANVFNLLNQGAELDRSVALIRTASATPSIVNEYNSPGSGFRYGTSALTMSQSYQVMLQQIANYRTQFATQIATFGNPYYNLPVTFQSPRQFRFNVGIQW